MIDALIKNGAEIDAQENDGITALMSAASLNQNPEVMLRLLKYGATVKKKVILDRQRWVSLQKTGISQEKKLLKN